MYNFILSFVAILSLLFPAPIPNIEISEVDSEPVEVMDSDLIITEIMYNPSGSDSDWEWIEIYNKGTLPIDMTGYVFDDNSSTQISAANIAGGVLQPQQSAILYEADGVTEQQFKDVWGNANLIPVTNWPTLGNGSGDTIGIWDSFENYDGDNKTHLNATEHITYKNNEEGWPNDDGSASIFLIALDADNTIGENWALSTDGINTPLNTSYMSMALHGNSGNDIGSPGSTEIEDRTPPEIVCPEMVETDHDLGLCSSLVPLLLPSATDNISTEFTFSATRSDGFELEDPFPVGHTMITWTATDEAGNTSTPCEQLITVVEVELPTAIAQNITVELDENGQATIDPQELDNQETPSFDNCGIAEYMASRTQFDCNDIGNSVALEFSVLDANGNTSTVTNVEVLVVDKLQPILSCSEDIVATTTGGAPLFLLSIVEPAVSDNCDSNPLINASRSDEAELSDAYPVGMTTITWQATDSYGNTSQCTQLVTIEDTVVNEITFEVNGNTGDFNTELEVGDEYIVGEISNIQSDNDTSSLITGQELVDTSAPGGPYLVTYEVSDGRNTSFIVETVVVNEPSPTVLSVTSFTLVNAETNEDLFDLEEGMKIDFRSLPTLHLDIRANVTQDVESVRLMLGGELTVSRTENVAPYAVYGDFPQGQYFGNDFRLGAYSITASPYSADLLGGEMGEASSLNFEIVDPCMDFEISLLDFADPSTCGGADGLAFVASNGGTEPIVYSWSHDAEISGDLLTDLPAGSYTVIATDANDCSSEISFELKDPELPEVALNAFPEIFEDEPSFELKGGFPEGGKYSGEGVVDGMFDPSIGEGTYEITYTYIDSETLCSNTASETITVAPAVLKVNSFTLVNADNNEELFEITEGMQIDINTLPTLNLNIKANTTDDIESVRLSLSGTMTSSRTENVSPYALFGDFPVENYFGNTFVLGSYTLTADPYAEDALGGQMGISLSINFELVNVTFVDVQLFNPLIVSPNPASIETTISFKKSVKLVTMTVFDIHGRLVHSFDTTNAVDVKDYTLYVQDLAPGSYFVKSQDTDGTVYQKQVIVTK